MATTNSTKQRQPSLSRQAKPAKPRPDFPLTPSGNGQWVKRINKKVYCFGKVNDPQAALTRYLEEKEYLENGKIPPRRRAQQEPGYLSVLSLCTAFLLARENDLKLGYISQRHYDDQQAICKTLIAELGSQRAVSDLGPDDFRRLREHLSKRKTGKGMISGVRVKNLITRCRQVFNFAWKECLIETPVRFGTGFSSPPKKTLRKERNAAAAKYLEPAQVKALLAVSGDQLRAMIMLAVNGGLNNSDLAAVQISDFDFQGGWLNFARVKTAINRRIPLWPETVAAIRQAIVSRPAPKDEADAGCLFVTKYGGRWKGESAISHEFAKLKDAAGITGKGIGITALRHVFQTVGENATGNSFAVRAIMGHVDGSISGHYREHVSDDRLRAVVDAVHAWLFGQGKGGAK